jgi:hypothetical protein
MEVVPSFDSSTQDSPVYSAAAITLNSDFQSVASGMLKQALASILTVMEFAQKTRLAVALIPQRLISILKPRKRMIPANFPAPPSAADSPP